jgi:hypothetical protein
MEVLLSPGKKYDKVGFIPVADFMLTIIPLVFGSAATPV